MAWPLRRLAKGVLINTTWNPLGSFRLFSWCLWPFQDCRYQTNPFLKRKNQRGVWKTDCMILFGQRRRREQQQQKRRRKAKRYSCVYLAGPVTDVLLCVDVLWHNELAFILSGLFRTSDITLMKELSVVHQKTASYLDSTRLQSRCGVKLRMATKHMFVVVVWLPAECTAIHAFHTTLGVHALQVVDLLLVSSPLKYINVHL